MRFSLTHKLTTYLMVCAAVASLWLSPEVSQFTKIFSAVAIAISWFAEPSRFPVHRLTPLWNIATLGFFVYLVIGLFHESPVITTGVNFLLFVLINKLFNRIGSKDYRQVYVISFLVLVAATTLNTDITYAACFTFYVIFATWALTLFHLRREIEENYLLRHADGLQSEKVEVERILNSRRIVGRHFLAGTSLVSFGVLIMAAGIFLLFPRVGFGLFLGHRRGGVMMVGFSEKVELGHHGVVRDNPLSVMRVFLPREKSRVPFYWRGTVYDTYDSGVWSHASDVKGVTVASPMVGEFFLVNPNAPGLQGRALTPELIRERLLEHRIQREPILESNIIFAADRPVALRVKKRSVTGRYMFTPRRGPFREIRGKGIKGRGGVEYTAYSLPYRPPASVLGSSRLVKIRRYRPYLQFPRSMPTRVRELAQKITRDHPTVHGKVKAVQRYLKKNYAYTLQLTHDPKLEPLDEFLFVTRRGHCEYFASAMALMLRAAGIHTRQVNGFVGGEWNEMGQYLAVKHGDAHAWVEVYFHGAGWIRFDPTPSGEPPRAYEGAAGWVRQLVDAMRMRWLYYVVEYDLTKQVEFFREVARVFEKRSHTSDWGPLRPYLYGVGAVILLVLAVVIWRRLRFRIRRGGPGGRVMSLAAVSRLYARMLEAVARAGYLKPAGLTPLEFAEQLGGSFSGSDQVQRFTGIYYDVRYGQQELSRERSRELDGLLGEIRQEARGKKTGSKG